ncbi:pyroglutamylated RF-amide peptide receptor [Acipenser oxyrinchus oxyrinchus]|uniref:Pyroglutamylated RF-amide peptide receptor n=1 Tax=Acipenser oxyrinchus oxyrinchus TaxID=40147 RepID=A0AAD8CMD1_ACIOX|nr:pyroglutamylated RF-amide peptide receptor [Acipenser oxyrinchus oxyrinchus]
MKAPQMNITPEVLEFWLQESNLSRQQFIKKFGLQPLVFVPRLPAALQPALGVLYGLIFVLALAGNVTVLMLLCREKALKSNSAFFVCSLALSDLLISLFCIPATLLQHFSTNWLAGQFLCKLVPFAQVTAVSTSIFTMLCIAGERFQGILYPLQLRSGYSPSRDAKILAVVWLAALAIAFPMWYAHKVEVKYDFLFDVHYTCCQEVWPRPQQRQAYTTALLVLVFLVPMATMGVLYGKIISELWGKHRVRDVMFQTLPCSEIHKITRKKRRAVKMMVVVVLLFAFCWTPFHLVSILTDYGKLWLPAEQELLLFTAVQLLGFSNSVCNPVAYAALNENFKKRVLCLLLQRGAEGRREGRLGGPGARVGISTVESPRVGERTERSTLGAGRLSSRIAWEPRTSTSFPPVHLFRATPKQHSAPLMLSVTDPLTLPAAAP